MKSTTISNKIQGMQQRVPTSTVVSKMLDNIELEKETQQENVEVSPQKTGLAAQRKAQTYSHD